MAIPTNLKVLFFDVFGTTVAQLPPVANEFHKATQEALASNTSLKPEIRSKATSLTYDDWFKFGSEWNHEIEVFTNEGKARDHVDWKAVDRYRKTALISLLVQKGVVIQSGHDGVQEGSLWTSSQLDDLVRVWRRLTPWPDTVRGLELLNQKYTTVTLSNTYQELMESLVAFGKLPFKHVFTAELFDSYKPNSKVYLGAAEKLGFKPEECGLVAAHLGDLKGAKACGFYLMYVERPFEEKTPQLREENIPQLVVNEDEEGFIALAKKLGVQGA